MSAELTARAEALAKRVSDTVSDCWGGIGHPRTMNVNLLVAQEIVGVLRDVVRELEALQATAWVKEIP